jgi:hypothetical protein
MRARFILAGVVVLALAACASTSTQPIATTTNVNVIVTTAPSVEKMINVEKTTALTKSWLSKLAPDAAPLTVALRFTDTAVVNQPLSALGADAHGNPEPVTYTHAAPSLSPTPWSDGSQPVISSTTVAENSAAERYAVAVRGTYTITDGNGATLDEGPIVTTPGDNNQRELAWFVANRVKELGRPNR